MGHFFKWVIVKEIKCMIICLKFQQFTKKNYFSFCSRESSCIFDISRGTVPKPCWIDTDAFDSSFWFRWVLPHFRGTRPDSSASFLSRWIVLFKLKWIGGNNLIFSAGTQTSLLNYIWTWKCKIFEWIRIFESINSIKLFLLIITSSL